MNDFTKEELNGALCCIRMVLKKSPMSENNYKCYGMLADKIKFLIENYCEQHEADEFENPDFCKHCDKRFR